ncbi:hypothetical protein [Thiofilum flexile]|uniref:hypothetical protein n=1 Tax=Thiofilum flexile TaxID=125627 RepID=UPI00036CBA7D|nr:hypothetical protein [Thiofilum flexile]
MWKSKLVVLALMLSSTYLNTSQARPAAPLPNVHIAGQVFFAGKPAAGVTVQARYNCFTYKIDGADANLAAKATSDANGYYRLRVARAPAGSTYVAAVAGKVGTKAYANYCNPNALSGEDLTSKTKRFNINLQPATPPSAAETQCLKAKGEWGWLNSRVMGCNVQYSDASKECTDNKDCKGNMCLAGRRTIAGLDRNSKITGYCAGDTYSKYNASAEIRTGKVVFRKLY